MEKEKLEAVKQWTNDPCGAVYSDAYEEGSKEFFEATSDSRDKTHPWIKKMINELDVKGKSLLEIGCGLGTDLLSFAKNGARVTGLDLTPKHIELAEKLFKINDLQAKFVVGDAENMSFPAESFDVIYSLGVLHHTPGIQKAIAEIHRVLKPGGLAVVGLYHKNSWHYWINLILVLGIFQCKLLKMSVAEMMSSSVEVSHSDARPLVRVYSKGDCRRLFKDFSNVITKKDHWTSDQIPSKWLASHLPKFLPSFLGWYIVVFAMKDK